MSQVQQTLDHLFRRESGRIVAHLTRFFGPDHIDLAESVVQEALLKAVQVWPVRGIPDNPAAWIMTVAKNTATDLVRQQKLIECAPEIIEKLAEVPDPSSDMDTKLETEVKDDLLRLMFICCHPMLSPEARLALTLKTVCGFSVPEIARAFLAKEETVAQRIVRAKAKIAASGLTYELPSAADLEERLDSVLDVLYLLFNEGYSATEGNHVIRADLCEEAIYQARNLSEHPICANPKLFALLALMHFQASRFNARVDPNGELVLLEEQDRSAWDSNLIAEGLRCLELSAVGDELSSFHLQAGIAACHALSPSFEETDWARIVEYYDLLLTKSPSPIVALNRAVAIAMAVSPAAGLEELESLRTEPALKGYYLLPAALGELYRRSVAPDLAKRHYEEALKLVSTEPERRLILKRIAGCS